MIVYCFVLKYCINKCRIFWTQAYFGGLARCEAETSGWWEPNELVCGACSDVAGARTCPKHGADFLEYKCRYCCSVSNLTLNNGLLMLIVSSY